MKVFLIKVVFLLAIWGTALSETTEAKASIDLDAKERNLQNVSFFDDVFDVSNVQVSIGIIKDMIIDEHKNIKLCIETEFQKDIQTISDFPTILRGCVGDNYSIVLRFYDNINQYIRELTKDNIKSQVRTNFCVQNFIPCLEFFKTIGMFIDMDYDLIKSVDMNINELNRKIGERVVRTLMDITHQELDDYVAIRTYLLEERKFLNEYFRQKYLEYVNKYGSLTANPIPPPEPPALL